MVEEKRVARTQSPHDSPIPQTNLHIITPSHAPSLLHPTMLMSTAPSQSNIARSPGRGEAHPTADVQAGGQRQAVASRGSELRLCF